MAETFGNKRVIQGEDIILLVDEKTTLHATTHTLKVDLELKELRTKDTNGKEKAPGDISWSVDGDGLVVVDDSIQNAHSPEDVLALVLGKKLSSRRWRVLRRCIPAGRTSPPSRWPRPPATMPLTVIRSQVAVILHLPKSRNRNLFPL